MSPSLDPRIYEYFNNVSDTWGREFNTGIPGGPDSYQIRHKSDDHTITLTILTKLPGSVNVSAPGVNFSPISQNVQPGSNSLTLPSSLIHYTPPYFQKKGIQITSSVDVSVVMSVSSWYWDDNAQTSVYGNMRLLPVSALGSEYVVPYGSDRDLFITGVEQNTNFNITYTDWKGQQVISGHLNKFDSYLLNNSTGSGAFILSSKPIAVFSSSFTSAEFLFEQIIPGQSWGYKYILPSILRRRDPINFRVFALSDDTDVLANFSSQIFTININRGTYVESSETSGPITLSANKPIMVMQSGSSDKFLTTVPAVTQFGKQCTFVIPSIRYNHYVVIIIKKAYRSGLTFYDQTFPDWYGTDTVTLDGDDYVAMTFLMTRTGYHIITHTSPEAQFGGFVFGIDGSTYMYGYPLEMILRTNTPGKSNT